MTVERRRATGCAWVAMTAMAAIVLGTACAAEPARTCEQVALMGEVSAGHAWQAAFGQGWVFRLLPIRADKPDAGGLTGWDLVVDRERGSGYPDALLLATPPYNSINEREVGTTYGLRAQDAIGWNPRSFRFMTDPAAFHEAQKLFLSMNRQGWTLASGARGPAAPNAPQTRKLQRLMRLASQSSSGEFRILAARLTPGAGDAPPYAENWALQSRFTPQTDVPAPDGRITPQGEIEWIRFSIALQLPRGWKSPREVHAVPGGCGG